MDKIKIKELKCDCIIGTFEHERLAKQPVVFNIILGTNLAVAGRSGNLGDSVDYFDLREKIINHVTESSYLLVEQLAEAVANICLTNTLVQWVNVELEKPLALKDVKTVAVEIYRHR